MSQFIYLVNKETLKVFSQLTKWKVNFKNNLFQERLLCNKNVIRKSMVIRKRTKTEDNIKKALFYLYFLFIKIITAEKRITSYIRIIIVKIINFPRFIIFFI